MNYNYYVPQFVSVGSNTINIQDIGLNDGGAGLVGYGDMMYVVGPLGNATESYAYYMKTFDMSGTVTTDYFWGDGYMMPVDVSFDKGDGIAIENPNGLSFQISNAGEVICGNVSFTAHKDYNWTGNPFSTAISIQDVSLDDGGAGLVGYGDMMYIVGPLGNATESYAYYMKTFDMSGTVTTDYFWGDGYMMSVQKSINPGDHFAVENPNELVFDVVIACPYQDL